jgi:hypothetical protein
MRRVIAIVLLSIVTSTAAANAEKQQAVAVEIFNAYGDPAPGNTSLRVNLEPFGMTQINNVLKRVDAEVGLVLIIRVGVVSEQGTVLSYLSPLDNTTNDTPYQEGFRFGF